MFDDKLIAIKMNLHYGDKRSKVLPWLACVGSETLTDSCPVKELTPIMPLWVEPESWVCPRGTL